jgi:hypothetical protein
MGGQTPFADFLKSIETDAAPPALGAALRALWHDRRGQWDEAHTLAQAAGGSAGAWVHAYLHRKEGDPGNAGYWYRQAGQPVATGPLPDEWERIARALLGNGG